MTDSRRSSVSDEIRVVRAALAQGDVRDAVDRLADCVLDLERDLSFLARHVRLSDAGHATTEEYVRAQELMERHSRWEAGCA